MMQFIDCVPIIRHYRTKAIVTLVTNYVPNTKRLGTLAIVHSTAV